MQNTPLTSIRLAARLFGLAVLGLLLGLLAACGGSASAPTATPVPPAATSTIAPTPAPGGAAATPAPTGTSATSGAGGVFTPVSTDTPGGAYQAPVTGSGADLVKKARAAMSSPTLKSYHFLDQTGAQSGGNGTTISLEGDRIIPDRLRVSASISGTTGSLQQIVIGDQSWASSDNGATWNTIPASDVEQETSLKEIQDDLNDAESADDLGDTTLDGTAVHHVRIAEGNVGGAAGFTIEVWTDKATDRVLQLQIAMQAGTGQSQTTGGRTIKLSKINDPSITITPPAAGSVDQPTATAAPEATDTAEPTEAVPPTDTAEPTETPEPTDTASP